MARILIVDDNGAVRAALRVLLEFEGYDVSVAASGPAALEAAVQSNVDVVVLDLNLPGMHGHAVIEGIRSRASELPIIAMSGFLFRDITDPGDDVLMRALALGATTALSKPFRPSALLNAIRSCLATAEGMRGAADGNAADPRRPPGGGDEPLA